MRVSYAGGQKFQSQASQILHRLQTVCYRCNICASSCVDVAEMGTAN